MVSKNSVNPGVVSPEVSSGDFWMKFLDEDERELDSGKMLQNYFVYKEHLSVAAHFEVNPIW